MGHLADLSQDRVHRPHSVAALTPVGLRTQRCTKMLEDEVDVLQDVCTTDREGAPVKKV